MSKKCLKAVANFGCLDAAFLQTQLQIMRKFRVKT